LPYRILDDAPTADVGFVASGDSLDACFQAAADATLEAMLANPDALQVRDRRVAHIENDTLDLALLNLLEELIYYKDAEGLFLRAVRVVVAQRAGRWIVEATLEGEPIDATRHRLSADVKAVTVHRLTVRRANGGWEATVVLDV
jgi:SHS2 domain-containing protein